VIRTGASLNGRAAIVGCGDYMEIWERESWVQEQAALAAEESGTTGTGASEGGEE
jgi:DNA-binding transcriptional regulator/RsmH inhibitor MraZ